MIILLLCLAQEVTLPLSEYMALKDTVAERQLTEAVQSEAARLVSCAISATVDDEAADLAITMELDARVGLGSVAFSLPGWASRVRVEPDTGSIVRDGKTYRFIPSDKQRYRVTASTHVLLTGDPGHRMLRLAPIGSAVTEIDMTMPSDWRIDSCNAGVVADALNGDQRRVRLAPSRSAATEIVFRDMAENVVENLVQSTRFDLVDLNRLGASHSTGFYVEVIQGELPIYELSGVAWQEVEHFATDEGPQLAATEDRVHRSRSGSGFLSWQKRGEPDGQLANVSCNAPQKHHYLVLASHQSVDLTPQPEKAWRRLDITELPDMFGKVFPNATPLVAWLRTDPSTAVSYELRRFEEAPRLSEWIEVRQSTVMLTDEGQLVVRDEVALRGSNRASLHLPAGFELWTASVEGIGVRPIVQGDRVILPLPLSRNAEVRAELVLIGNLGKVTKRQPLELVLPQWDSPVLRHDCRWLLPERFKYRYRTGDLAPAALEGARSLVMWDQTSSEPKEYPAGSAQLSGTVTDPYGGPLPGAVVELDADNMYGSRSEVSRADGRFYFQGLKPGFAVVRVTLPGMQSQKLQVMLKERRRLDVTVVLTIEAVSEELVVTAAPDRVGSYYGTSGRTTPHFGGDRDDRHAELKAKSVLRSLTKEAGKLAGVKPIPFDFPESGKLMEFSAVLPPAQVALALDVK
ncbi:MAG: carboxypeptidase regulatory-like domain-containing protein [Acidobacteria bacterium]|nr:carboxypeptidase regulatory-like domain-containing protein [Acidobacteriota bacterium]